MTLNPIVAAAAALWLVATSAYALENAVNRETSAPYLLDTIQNWLTANFELRRAPKLPKLAKVSARELVEIRYGSTSAVAPGDVVATYDRDRGAILLADDWTGQSVEDISVLVHEMVHHMQVSAGMRYACPAEMEKLAYEAQDAWLKLFRSDLDRAFGIDDMTLLFATVCTH